MARDGKVKQRQHLYHHGDTICHPKSGYVTTELHGKSTCRSLGSSCQTGNMAALLNSLFVVFKISFLPKYRVIYYDYIVKWCSGILCNWCVSLDITKMLALRIRQGVYLTREITDLLPWLQLFLRYTKWHC